MATCILTVGRNVQGVPMSDERWSEFRSDLSDLVNEWADEIYTYEALGHGLWDGVREDSVTWVFSAYAEDCSTHFRFRRQDIARLAAKYGQDAIALVRGESELIAPSGVLL